MVSTRTNLATDAASTASKERSRKLALQKAYAILQCLEGIFLFCVGGSAPRPVLAGCCAAALVITAGFLYFSEEPDPCLFLDEHEDED